MVAVSWAAIAPICGGGDPAKAATIKDIPCWCFHGDADKAVPVEKSREKWRLEATAALQQVRQLQQELEQSKRAAAC